MKYYYILTITFLLTSCMAKVPEKKEEVVDQHYDSVIEASEKLHDSIIVHHLPKADHKISKLKEKIVNSVDSLRKENSLLKKEAMIVKTVVVRDTIYIKEKTNFWGKKKVSTDSVQSIDSTIVEYD